jgi:hypothetical protein
MLLAAIYHHFPGLRKLQICELETVDCNMKTTTFAAESYGSSIDVNSGSFYMPPIEASYALTGGFLWILGGETRP